ncbi:DUF2924 domain-containing protein [Pseudohalocynthiibacter aestuariivivens]|uniref:DUF2924 domain-containing protein n=1 Tax=Pseudohalocynthiibacter aestuariivivens TaxID=1591409 RepID=A0ABV5JH02_9RHOB|nr:DUF2924 domain-containing protein [Pseudohalocynthiibacter aestuariivivens]
MTEFKKVTLQAGPGRSKCLHVAGCTKVTATDERREELLVPELANLKETIVMLADLDNEALRVTWKRVWKYPAPKAARKRFMMLGIAWKWQAGLLGGFRPELARRLAALEVRSGESLRGPYCSAADLTAAARPGPGTWLIRDWRGERHEVHVTEKGYLWRRKEYGSLSAVAKAITGVSRNGPKFFGLRDG